MRSDGADVLDKDIRRSCTLETRRVRTLFLAACPAAAVLPVAAQSTACPAAGRLYRQAFPPAASPTSRCVSKRPLRPLFGRKSFRPDQPTKVAFILASISYLHQSHLPHPITCGSMKTMLPSRVML